MANYYPDIEISMLTPLRIVFEEIKNDPLWLERADCPYDKRQIAEIQTFWKLMKPGLAVSEADIEDVELGDRWGALADSQLLMLRELKAYGSMIDAGDTKEKMSYFRTATTLLEKLTGLAERTTNVKKVSEFMGRVHMVFEQILTAEQRTKVMNELEMSS